MDAWNILNFMQQIHYEQAVLKSKYDKLLSFLAEILDRKNYEERMTLEKNRPRCKYQNKGYCKQGQGCSFSHNSDICEEYLCSGSCNKGRVCHQRHPRKCKHWFKGKCWRGNSCAYLHKKEDFNKHVEKESVEVPDKIVNDEYLDEDIVNDPNMRYKDHVANRKNDDIDGAEDIYDDDSQQEIENSECKECTNDDKCVPCIMIKAYDDPNSSYGSYEEESIESIMAKARAFEF